MPAKVRTAPRKQPTQDRARATVDAILTAAARILVRDGFERTTTNRVAEAAGVSIGSLYQYFPSKEALVAALLEQHIVDMRNVITGALDQVRALPIRQAVRVMVELMLQIHAVDPALHRVLVEQVPRTGKLGKMRGFEQELYQIIVGYLRSHQDELRPCDIEQAAFLIVCSVEAATHAAVLYQPERLSDPAFVDEVCALVTRYLLP